MTLEKILKLDEINNILKQNNILVRKNKSDIDFITKNNITVSIHKQNHVLPENERLIYLDCLLGGYGLPEFRRDWHEGEDLPGYIISIVIPFIANIKGPLTLDKNKMYSLIHDDLAALGIKSTYSEKDKLKYIQVNYSGQLYEEYLERNIFTFVVNDVKYGIAYKNSFISLLIFENIECKDVLTEYQWYSFCPITVGGEEYVKMTVSHFIDFIKTK